MSADDDARRRLRGGRDVEQLREPLQIGELTLDLEPAGADRRRGGDRAVHQVQQGGAPDRGDHQVRAGETAFGDLDRALLDQRVHDHPVGAVDLVAQLDALRGVGPEGRVEGQNGRVDGEHVVPARLLQRAGAPQRQVEQDLVELAAVLGELVDQAGVELGAEAPANDPGLLELVETGRQDARRDLGQARQQLVVPLGTKHEVAQDEQRPALADHLEGAGDAAELSVGTGWMGDHAAVLTYSLEYNGFGGDGSMVVTLGDQVLMQDLDVVTGFDAKLAGQPRAQPAVHRHRVGAAAAAAERPHQLPVQALVERTAAGQRPEFADQFAMPAAGDLGLDTQVQGAPLLLEQLGSVAGEDGAAPDVRQWRIRAEVQCGAVGRGRPGVIALVLPFVAEPAQPGGLVEVYLGRVDVQHVAGLHGGKHLLRVGSTPDLLDAQ